MLLSAGILTSAVAARIDEEAIKDSLLVESAKPRDVADTLAEMKARKVADKLGAGLVLGCDQVLELGQKLYSKPKTPEDLRQQLQELRGKTHKLLSAAVVYEDGKPVWRHIGEARLTMRDFSDAWADDYIARNWDSVRHSVGGYKLEEEGVQLFQAISGDHFTILGLPLLPLLSWMQLRGILPA